MRTLVVLGYVLAGVCTPFALGAGDAKSDQAKLQGTWVAVSLVEKGKAEPPDRVRTLKLIIMGNKYIYQLGSDDKRFVATFKIDPTTKPKSMDVVFDAGPLKGKTMKSIYAFDGDELRICGGRDKRPSEFSSTQGDGEIVFTFIRVKKQRAESPK
ncbi:MAG: TIGR03067 domain-containing protein [Planctomycetes bacterium]|jgi:uncharacterized protein (TIGR03067 family)|nr:TIGR03067 domain-containing protein [Planctomycetota bacterium]